MLQKMREYEYDKVGPGAYSIGVEKLQVQSNTGRGRDHGKAVASAFSTTETRNLDTRTVPQKENPGPGNYLTPKTTFDYMNTSPSS